MPNRTAAQVNNHDNAQAQVSFPVNIEAGVSRPATPHRRLSRQAQGARLCETPDDAGDDFSRSCGCRPRDRDCHGEAADGNGKSGAAPVVRFWRGSPIPQRQGGLAFCACPAPDGENASLARGGQL